MYNACNAVITIVEETGVVGRIQHRVDYTTDDFKRKQCVLEDLTNHAQQSGLIDQCLCSYQLASFFIICFEIGEGDIL
jgi:hypothetical protein